MIKLALILLSLQARPSSLESKTIQNLMVARQPQQVLSQVKIYQSLRESKLACQLQIRQKTLPTECYRLLAIEKSQSKKDTRHWKTLRLKLDNLCARNSQLSLRSEDAAIPVGNPYISSTCNQHLQILRSFNSYQKQSEAWSEN